MSKCTPPHWDSISSKWLCTATEPLFLFFYLSCPAVMTRHRPEICRVLSQDLTPVPYTTNCLRNTCVRRANELQCCLTLCEYKANAPTAVARRRTCHLWSPVVVSHTDPDLIHIIVIIVVVTVKVYIIWHMNSDRQLGCLYGAAACRRSTPGHKPPICCSLSTPASYIWSFPGPSLTKPRPLCHPTPSSSLHRFRQTLWHGHTPAHACSSAP